MGVVLVVIFGGVRVGMVVIEIRVGCALVVILDGVGVGMIVMVMVAVVEIGVGLCTDTDFW